MSKKRFNILAIVVGLMAAWIISGCQHKSAPVVISTNSSIMIQLDHQYPQMWTPYMLDNMDAIAKEHGITWLGCYDDTLDGFILWEYNDKTGKCLSSVVIPPDIHPVSCDEGWELYLEVCKQIGNCEQLI
jgi:hypothetical protein